MWSKKKKVHLPSKVVFYHRSSSIKGHFPSKIAFHQRLTSIKCHLQSKGVFHQKLSSAKGHLPLYTRWCSSSKIDLKNQFQPISYFLVVGLLVSASSVQLNWAQTELGKNKLFWESRLWLAIWEISRWKFR